MTFYVVTGNSGNRRVIHADRDCVALQDTVADIREAHDAEEQEYGRCKKCTEPSEAPRTHGTKLPYKLLEMDPDEVSKESVEGSL